jgi:hypothetical protein
MIGKLNLAHITIREEAHAPIHPPMQKP